MITVDDNDPMPFGKHRGEPSYLVWLWNETDLRDALRMDTPRGALARYVKLAVIGNKPE